MVMVTQSKRVKAKQPYKKHLSSKIGAFIFGEFERRKTMEYQGRWYRKVTLRGNDYVYANFGTRGVIRVYNADGNTKRMMKKYGARKLANECRYIYRTIHGEDINISTLSLAIELIGHVFPDKLLIAVESKALLDLNFPLIPIIELLRHLVRKRTDVIDCGESQLDNNRTLWDKLEGLPEEFYELINDLM